MILVTGGTGFVGHDVVRELLALGYKVRLLVRHPHIDVVSRDHPGVEQVQGDALKPETLPAAMEGVHAVVHLIGIIAETADVTFEQAHTEATRNILAAARQAGVTRWVQMSALGTRPAARSRYHLTKWEAEELVRRSGLDWTIFRPSLIYGYDERDRLLNFLRMCLSWPLDFIQLYTFPVLDGGRVRIQPVSLREVAHCFARTVSNAASIGQTYDLVGPVAFSWREMIFKVAQALRRNAAYEEIPLLGLLRILLWLAGVLLLPGLIIAGTAMGALSLAKAEIAAAVWVALVIIAARWKQLIVFSIPSEPLLLAALGWEIVAPRRLQFGEQLKMAQEDNVGDPQPAARTFAYAPESFEQGLKHLLFR